MKVPVLERISDTECRDQQVLSALAYSGSSLGDFETLNDITSPFRWYQYEGNVKPFALEVPHPSIYENIEQYHRVLAFFRERSSFIEPINVPVTLSHELVEPQEDEEVEEVFNALVEEWRSETEMTSSFTDMILHPAYQKIIGLGSPAIRLLLHELERRPAHWFWALAHITRENPIRDEDAGRLEGMTEAWLEWGRQRGYL